jgi:CheY-like chemotaxis protein
MRSALSPAQKQTRQTTPCATTILVVEDDADIRDLVVHYLADQGYRVLAAANGEAALQILRGGETIELLLADIVMPGSVDGLALARETVRLRPATKILHVTGHSDRIAARAALMSRGELLSKPFRPSELIARITRLLGSWAVRRNPILRRGYDFWLQKCAGRPFPDRTDLDPSEIKDILPHLTIIEVAGNDREARFRYRLVGTAVVDAVGKDRTGCFADEFLQGRHAAFLCGLWQEVCASGCPIYAASAYDIDSDDRALSSDLGLSRERLLLPFSVQGDSVRQIVTVQTFDWKHRPMTVHQLEEQGRGRTDTVERLPGVSAAR